MENKCSKCGTGKLHIHIKPVKSMSEYLRSLGKFKDVPITDEQELEK